MRAFLGVPFPPLPGLVEVAGALASSGADLKVVPPAQYHLTLKFMGEVTEDLAARYADRLRAQSLPSPFDVSVRDVGAFPSWKRFTVLWAGIDDAAKGLVAFAAAAERAWAEVGGMPEDRPFRAHLTLARKRSDRGAAAATSILEQARGRDFGSVRIDHANLYRSTLTATGPIHDVVARVSL